MWWGVVLVLWWCDWGCVCVVFCLCVGGGLVLCVWVWCLWWVCVLWGVCVCFVGVVCVCFLFVECVDSCGDGEREGRSGDGGGGGKEGVGGGGGGWWGLSGRPGGDTFRPFTAIFTSTLKLDNCTRSCQTVCRWCHQ